MTLEVEGLSFTITPLPFLPASPTPDAESFTLDNVNSYSHDIHSIGGFWSASLGISSIYEDLEQWTDQVVGRMLTVTNPSGIVVWEGIINNARIVYGPFEIVIGPYLDIQNRLGVTFNSVKFNTKVPVGGGRYVLPDIDDTISQSKYGILQSMLSGGEGTPAEMLELQQLMVAEFSNPKSNQRLSLSGSGGNTFSIQLDCVGFARLLEKYFADSFVFTDVTYDTKIKTILGDDPNGVWSTLVNVASNPGLIDGFEDGTRTAWNAIRDVVNLGDSSGNRWLFSVGRDQTPRYNQVVNEVSYIMRLSNPSQNIFDVNNNVIDPWDVEPGRFIQITDFIPGVRLETTELFIESVKYTYPFNISLNGGRFSQAEQLLARKGIGGIS